MRLTGKQRDFLASYPNDVEVIIEEEGDEGDLLIETGDDLHEDFQSIVVPPEGFIGQPHVVCHDWEEALHQIPVKAMTEDMLETLRQRHLLQLPQAVGHVFFCLMAVMDSECPDGDVDWDDVLVVLVRNLNHDEEDEEDDAEEE